MSEPDKPPGPDRDQAPRLADAVQAPEPRGLPDILAHLPPEPGVYVMRDRKGKVLYVGKAASLRQRVRQYFQPNTGDTRLFVPLLGSVVADIETLVTSNEKEALLLENTLIKKYRPRFNVNLKDDKNYLVLRLDPSAEWPRLEVTRRLGDDGAHYFGPYHSATSCRETLRVVNRHFQLRTCTDHVLHNRRRPCLQYQIKRCPGPCVLPVSRDEYGEQVRDVRLFLDGKNEELLDRLRGRMKDAARDMQYERAATVRDQLQALDSSLQEQHVVSGDFQDQDALGYHRDGLALEIVVVSIRAGKMVGSRAFSFTGQEFPDPEILSTFLGLYYDMNPSPPDEVLLPFAIEDAELKQEWLTELRDHPRGRKVSVLVPQRGPRCDLIDLARKNAAASFASRRNAHRDAEEMLAKLQRRLKLPTPPRTIECYDISHMQGSETVASMVVFVDGKPEKSRYRTFKLRFLATGAARGARKNDDFAAMYEVLSRRFRRAREAMATGEHSVEQAVEGATSTWALPDLVVVDGGKGQLGMALAAARDVGIDTRAGAGLPIIALAKERDLLAAGELDALIQEGMQAAAPAGKEPRNETRERRPDRVFLPHAKDPVPIRPNSAEMFVLQHLRDEAHRFAVTFHRAQRKRRTLRSALTDVEGIGPSRQRALLRHFGSLRKIKDASVEDLMAVDGMSRNAALAIRARFGGGPSPETTATPAISVTESTASAGENTAEDADEDAVESAFADVDDLNNEEIAMGDDDEVNRTGEKQ
jgi:excinuclease ABC subunit C